MWQSYNQFISTNIKQLWYNKSTYQLIVQYINGQQYTYERVGVEQWNNLKIAQSKGRFISQNIKSKPFQKKILNG